MSTNHPSGPYRHFKGTTYNVITVARQEADPSALEVIYISVGAPPDALPWSRPLASWAEVVEWPDGTKGPRFMSLLYPAWASLRDWDELDGEHTSKIPGGKK